MSFKKTATYSSMPVEVLNRPEGWEIFNMDNIKIASIQKEEEIGGFDLKSAVSEHPDHLFIKIFAIKRDEINDNGDAFSEAELEIAAHTFIGVPIFTNHQNDDIEKAKGECLHSWYDGEAGGIYIIASVDKLAYPKLARGVEEGYVSGTSMGCSVDFSCCSICHNMAHTSENYCNCIKNHKNRKVSGTYKCKYHESDSTEIQEQCPICGSTKNEKKSYTLDKHTTFEHNYGLKFIENSFVVNPACHECGVSCILHIPEVIKKVASFRKIVDKLANHQKEQTTKTAGSTELNELKDSMTKMEKVVKSMLEQKEHISMEYVSDLVKAMTDLQGIIDELTDQGYETLPSPAIIAEGDIPKEPFPRPVETPPQSMPQKQPQLPGMPQQQDMSGLGTITTPKFSADNPNKIKDSSVVNNNTSLIQDTENQEIDNKKEGNMSDKEIKTAAPQILDDNREIITEKQLEEKQTPIGSRTDEAFEGITESKQQIGRPEEFSNDTTSDTPQIRRGTYETITEDQLTMTTDDAIVRFNDVPDVITEKQWTEFSRLVSAKISADYTDVITDAQIRDLLSNHIFVIPDVITEGQLANNDKEFGLKRWANKNYTQSLTKTAIDSVTDAIARYQKSPKELKKAIAFIEDDDKIKRKVTFLTLINALPYKSDSIKTYADKVAYFSKTASKDLQTTPIDALILSIASNAQHGIKVEDVYEFVSKALQSKRAMNKVADQTKEILNGSLPIKETINKESAFENAITEMIKEPDGMYKIKASLKNDLGITKVADIKGKEDEFVKAVNKLAQDMIGEEIGEPIATVALDIKIYDDGTIEIIAKDADMCGEEDKPFGGDDVSFEDEVGEEVEEAADTIGVSDEGGVDENTPSSYAEQRDKIVKEAQMMGGEMGGQGGVSQAPGAGATLPQMPGMEQPGLETFTEEPGMEAGGELEETLEPSPPGSMCPVCGSNDVDIIEGQGKCNNCGSEMIFKVTVDVTKWAGLTDEASGEEEDTGEFGEGEGFELPEAGGMPEGGGMPEMAAMTRIKPEALKKIAESKIELGSISPATGQPNTIKLENGERICLDTGTKYKVAFATKIDNPKTVYAQWTWQPKIAGYECPSCRRAKKVFAESLGKIAVTKDNFEKMSAQDKGKTILKMQENKTLGLIKTASKKGSVVTDYKLAYGGYGTSFPMETCMEKLARRYGIDAIALSGPCEGSNLAECVCGQLKDADVYTNKIAMKVAEAWHDKSGTEECIEDQIKSGLSLRQASTVCSALKIALAGPEDMFAEELGDTVGGPDDMGPGGDIIEDPVEDAFGTEDPFAEDIDGGTVSIELPIDVLKQINEAVDIALDENTAAEEEHHGLDTVDTDVVDDVVVDGVTDGVTDEVTDEVSGEEVLDETAPMMEGGDMMPAKDPGCQTCRCEPCTCNKERKPALDPTEPTSGAKVTIQIEKNKGVTEQDLVNDVNGPADQDEQFVAGRIAETETEFKESEARAMTSSFSKIGKMSMDLSNVIEVLNKQSQGVKTIEHENVQDSDDIKPYSAGDNGSTIGHEEPPVAINPPDVPRNNATIGQEPSDLNPQDGPQPEIPVGSPPIAHEKEVGLDGGDNRYTGGDGSQGSGAAATSESEEKIKQAALEDELAAMRGGVNNSKMRLSNLAERILEAQNKKLEAPKPVADDEDIQPISGKSAIGGEEEFKADTPTNVKSDGDGSMIGHEKETLKSKPDSPKDHPTIPADNQLMGQEQGDEIGPEKQTRNKGTVIAEDESGNAKRSEAEAFRVAGRMVEAGLIKTESLQQKVDELKAYQPVQIQDFEKMVFASKKGLATVSDGLTSPIVINEASNQRNATNDLKNQLASMFTLGRQVEAVEMVKEDWKDAFGRS